MDRRKEKGKIRKKKGGKDSGEHRLPALLAHAHCDQTIK